MKKKKITKLKRLNRHNRLQERLEFNKELRSYQPYMILGQQGLKLYEEMMNNKLVEEEIKQFKLKV